MQELLDAVTKPFLKKNIPQIHPGDTVRVHSIVREGTKERVQVFEGVVLAVKHGSGINATFTVRKISFGIGVERVFPLHSPRIVKVERVKSSQTRRAKLYYLRGLTGKAARLKNEKIDRKVWEEKGAEAEIAKIEEAVAEEAEARLEEKAEDADVTEQKSEAMPDEVKADIAAGEAPEVVEEAKEIAEPIGEPEHNEAVAELKQEIETESTEASEEPKEA